MQQLSYYKFSFPVVELIRSPREVWRTVVIDCRMLATFEHFTPQYALTPLCDFTLLRCCCFQLLQLYYSTTNSWLWNIKKWGHFMNELLHRWQHMAMEVIGTHAFKDLKGCPKTSVNIVYFNSKVKICYYSSLGHPRLLFSKTNLLLKLWLWWFTQCNIQANLN